MILLHCIFLFLTGHTTKHHKDDVEKHKVKKNVQPGCVIGVVKKDKLNVDSKKHNDSNSMPFHNEYLFYK